jgi:hypothetical protein
MSYWNRAFVIKKEKAKADPTKIIEQIFCSETATAAMLHSKT